MQYTVRLGLATSSRHYHPKFKCWTAYIIQLSFEVNVFLNQVFAKQALLVVDNSVVTILVQVPGVSGRWCYQCSNLAHVSSVLSLYSPSNFVVSSLNTVQVPMGACS